MAEMRYVDFDLLIERSGGHYTARVLNSPAGQAAIDFSLPFSEQDIEIFLLKVGRPRRSTRRVYSPEMEAAKVFGGRLFETVFDHEVLSCFRTSLHDATLKGAGLRLRLRITNAPDLTDLPWEYLYNPSLNRFLSLSVETPLVRYLNLPEPIRPLSITPPLRVLVMISSPHDYAQLDVQQEWKKLADAVKDLNRRGLVAIERLNDATLTTLQRRLRQKEYHIFHFIGHGSFDKQADDGVLILEDEIKRGRAVSGQYLGTFLHNHRPLRMAILNACEGARASRSDPFAGAAQSLVQQGIPAVIAMQFEITDEAAITFAHEFYTAVADGYPVDAAMVEARAAIFAQGNNIEWGTPVLYMRAPDGRVFDIEQHRQIGPAPPPKPPAPSPPSVKWQKLASLAAVMIMGLASYFIWQFTHESNNAEVSPASAAYVSFEIDPPSAELRIDGKVVLIGGLKAYELPPGPHTLALSHPSYRALQDSFRLAPAETLNLKYNLTRFPESVKIRTVPIEPKSKPDGTAILIGTLSIISEPPKAEIWFKNKNWGLTPKLIPELPPGEYEIVLKKAGYKDLDTTAVIKAQQIVEITGELKPLQGTLQVLVKPHGDIYIDDQLKSNAAFKDELPIGSHKVYVVCEDAGKRKEWEEAIVVKPNQTHAFDIDFNRTVRINVIAIAGESANIAPSNLWGTIFVDGQSQEVETPQYLRLSVGLHVIEIRREGFVVEPASLRINLKEDRQEPLKFKLIKK